MSIMIALQAVLYAKDARALAGFYAQVLALPRVEEGLSFVRLATAGLVLTVVQAPEQLADGIVITQPPALREDTPIKLSFAVPDIEALRPLIEREGGGLRAASTRWTWHGECHLDGWDPEGNVFQLRQLDAV
jgi:predicted enzyme related to lactoylglutathione lyase